LMARTFPDSACRPGMQRRRCVCARSATYEFQGAEGFRTRCLITSRTVGFLRQRRIGFHGNVEHEVFFPEDTEVVNVLSQPREDFLAVGTPSYMGTS
jgi:hypothetical protein